LVKGVAQKIIKDLSTPDSFRKDWYGWSTNQLAHITLGIILAALISFANFMTIGEFAYKGILFAMVAFLFAAQQGRQWLVKPWDTVEDFIFVVIYGAGTVIVMFDEVSPGSPLIVTNIINIAPICAIVATHLFVGSVIRAAREVKYGTD
jgi:hypothetical protein